MSRKHLPDLDVLDSPLVSPSPLTSVGGIPGSAVAERIFNDPNSWDEQTGCELVEGIQESMAWLVEEIDSFKDFISTSDERERVLSMEQDGLLFRPFHERCMLLQGTDTLSSASNVTRYEAMQQEPSGPAALSPVSDFDRNSASRTGNLKEDLVKIWESSLRSPLDFLPSPPSDGHEESTGNHSRELASPSTPATSPLPVVSASTTWSFLEWYGIHPESPRKSAQSAGLRLRRLRPRGILEAPVISSRIHSEPPTSPPKVPLPPIPISSSESSTCRPPTATIRRLPSVPSLSEKPTVEPSQDGSLGPPETGSPATRQRSSSSVRSPPPVGPRPKGLASQRERASPLPAGRPSSRSPPRPLALRPPALVL
ncbi:hypothetical protein AX17_001586 [Amanita inopinata Kibby_2008]|nr:hypothetical protein AX17_001586 [Amanita inopinata Kibby_2008]